MAAKSTIGMTIHSEDFEPGIHLTLSYPIRVLNLFFYPYIPQELFALVQSHTLLSFLFFFQMCK
jgi:hypothetical protein